MSEGCSGFRLETRTRFDGSEWKEFHFPESHIVLTSAGADFVRQNNMSFLRDFAMASKDSKADVPARNFLEKGIQGEVFTTTHPGVVLKERAPSGSGLYSALYRMDYLTHAIESYCPRWISMPKHYGFFEETSSDREFLMIERVDEGVSVGDILTSQNGNRNEVRGPRTLAALYRNFPELDDPVKANELVQEIAKMFKSAYNHITFALRQIELSNGSYLGDLRTNPDNIVIEKLSTPVAGKPYKFWVIDQ